MVNNSNTEAEGSSNPNPLQELNSLVEVLDQLSERGHGDEIERPLEALKEAAEEIEHAWSGSCLGYHANVYYGGLVPPPPGEHFSPEWGIPPRAFVAGTTGAWIEHTPEDVTAIIYQRAGNPALELAREWEVETRNVLIRSRRDLTSILEIVLNNSGSTLLEELQEEAGELNTFTPNEVVQRLMPQKQIMSRDSLAISQGRWVPPHISVLADVYAIQNTTGITHRLAEIVRQVSTHISRQRHRTRDGSITGTTVFIGHGRSLIWLELKDFLEERLSLTVDEYNRISAAGVTTTDRLASMIETAGFAFLVMTGEDEQTDGKIRARENVVHEIGLFQGKLGVEKAIVLLEKGCEEFSNITGLGQIRFPKGNVGAKFEEIRQVLEREGILTG